MTVKVGPPPSAPKTAPKSVGPADRRPPSPAPLLRLGPGLAPELPGPAMTAPVEAPEPSPALCSRYEHTRWVTTQLPHCGWRSSHLIRRFLHTAHPRLDFRCGRRDLICPDSGGVISFRRLKWNEYVVQRRWLGIVKGGNGGLWLLMATQGNSAWPRQPRTHCG